MNKLNISILDFDNAQNEGVDSNKVSKLKVYVLSEDNYAFTIIESKCEKASLVEWLIRNKEKLINQKSLLETQNGLYSLANSINRFYEEVDVERESKKIDDIFEYRKSHGLRFALRGIDIPEVYIGLNHDFYEISYWKNDKNNWRFMFDIDTFEKTIDALIENEAR